jgi:putative tryptophan/tyrosine transport system substrate-binding protein
MRRRDFIAIVGGAATLPVAAHAQQAGRLPTIGFLGSDPVAFAPWIAAFVTRLRELGWIDGRTVAIEYQWSQGRTERYAEIAAEFVRRTADVVVTVGSAVPIVRQATSVIPIVFAVAIDPVRSGLVSSLAKPGGNVTGLSLQAANLAGKRLEILRELIPRLRRLAIIFNGGNDQTVLEMSDTEAAARELNLDVALVDLFRRAGDYVHRILQGAKPGDIPVEQPTKFELVLNLTTARALGLRVSERFLLRVDEVIE